MTETSHIATGMFGEQIAVQYLKKKGFSVVCRNYRKKWGELDIVAKKDNVLHFVEVKSTGRLPHVKAAGRDRYRPEDHFHARKRARMKRAIESYLHEYKVTTPYTTDLVVVYLERGSRKAQVEVLWDVVLEAGL